MFLSSKGMHKPRSPSRKKHLLKEFQFPGLHHRASHTSSPMSLTAKIELDSSMRTGMHIPQLSVKVSSETSTPTSVTPSKPLFPASKGTDQSLSLKLKDCQVQLEQLTTDYQKALEENESLRQQTMIVTSLRTTGSASTVFASTSPAREEEDIRQSQADEFEELTELLSDAHMSMALLLNECDDLRDKIKVSKTELNTIKFQNQMGGRPKDRQVDELSAELTHRNDELKAALKDKRKYESRLQDAFQKKQDIEIDSRALRDKVSILTRRSTEEFGSAADIYKKLTMVRNLISQSEERAKKVEAGVNEKKAKKKR